MGGTGGQLEAWRKIVWGGWRGDCDGALWVLVFQSNLAVVVVILILGVVLGELIKVFFLVLTAHDH